jgi:hypothetical protein
MDTGHQAQPFFTAITNLICQPILVFTICGWLRLCGLKRFGEKLRGERILFLLLLVFWPTVYG